MRSAKSRSSGLYGGNDEREQTLNQLLTEMDFVGDATVIVLATNRPESLMRRYVLGVLIDKCQIVLIY